MFICVVEQFACNNACRIGSGWFWSLNPGTWQISTCIANMISCSNLKIISKELGKQIKCLEQKREGGLIYKLYWLGWKLDCVTALFSWMKCPQLSQMVFPINTIYWERNVGISFDHNTKCLVYCEEYWLRIQLPLCCTCTFQVKCLFLCTFTSSQDIFNKHIILWW